MGIVPRTFAGRLDTVTESELYKALGALTRDRAQWAAAIPRVASLLTDQSVKIQAKALWLLGEMGLKHPDRIGEHVPRIAAILDSPEPLLRERAVVALGRIGRGDYDLAMGQRKMTYCSLRLV